MVVAGCLLDLGDVLGRVFLEFAGAIVAAEGNREGFLRVDCATAERALVVDRLTGNFHLLDEVVGILFEFALAVVAAEANEVALVVGCRLDGIAAEWACVVDRSGLYFGNGCSRILGEFALAITTAESDRVGGFLLASIAAERAFRVYRVGGDGANHGYQTKATQKGS